MKLFPQLSRRAFVASIPRIGVGAAVARLSSLNAAATQEPPITTPNAPFSRALNFAALKDWITSNEDFFVRSHFPIPGIDASRWTLSVGTEGAAPRVFSLEQLLKMPAVEQAVTLECAGNLVGWGGVSNARWTGVRLATLLKQFDLKFDPGNAVEVVLVGSDGGAEREAGGLKIDAYARSIPVSKAMDPNTLLAYRMNGAPLPAEHGGPVRAIIPGWYGMDSVKWLKQIVVSRKPFNGFYQANRYYEARRANGALDRRPLGSLRLKSQIARPVQNSVIPLGPFAVFGAAWCGDSEIESVELSFDSGQSWRPAKLGPDRAPFAWRLWSFDWTPQASGRYEIIVRARDGVGRVQPLERDSQIVTPYANNWADRRLVEIR